jgi:HK97 family phage portal protein
VKKIRLFGTDIRGPTKEAVNDIALSDPDFLNYFGIDATGYTQKEINETTYFVCMKHLSESMGKLPIRQYKITEKQGRERFDNESLFRILNIEPNPYMTASTFWQAVELNRNDNGNAFVLIKRYTRGRRRGQIKGLWPLQFNRVTIYVDDAGWCGKKNAVWYEWKAENDKSYIFSPKNILHFKSSMTYKGLIGIAVKDALKLQIQTAGYSEQFLQKLYKGNMFGGKILLQYTGDLDYKGKDVLIKSVERYGNSVGTGKFLPLPLGITASSLEMKLSDAEFSELTKLNALQIASAFGIKPNILNNYEKSSYSNSETQQLDFYINSLLPIIKQYSEELTRKLIYDGILEHDAKALFKLDPVKQMSVLKTGMNNLLYTVNEAREELGLPYIDNEKANIPVGNGNYITLDQVGEQKKGGQIEQDNTE